METTEQKLFKLPEPGAWSYAKILRSLIEATGYTLRVPQGAAIILPGATINEHPVTIEISFESVNQYNPRLGKIVTGVSIHFTHPANGYRKTYRGVEAKDGSIDLDAFKAKVEELAELHAKCEEQERIQKEAEVQRDKRIDQTRDRCSELGVVSGNGVRVQPGDGFVSLEFQGVPPEMAQKLMKVMREGI